LAGTAAIARLLVVAMAMQIVTMQRAEGMAAEVVFTLGAPAATTVLWYLGTSIALLRTPATETSSASGTMCVYR
jgi:hypothetical protein